jgi:hypothetical protein
MHMQKQLERQQKGREEKERLKTFTERGVNITPYTGTTTKPPARAPT